jgi:hypothetical protein
MILQPQFVMPGAATESEFSPLDLSPQIWLDASDGSTLTFVDGAISQWSDKSEYARHAIQTNSTYRPALGSLDINGLSYLYFNGGENLIAPTYFTSVGYSVFAVYQRTGSPTNPYSNAAIVLANYAGTDINTRSIQLSYADGVFSARFNQAQSSRSLSATRNDNVNVHVAKCDYSTAISSYAVNGLVTDTLDDASAYTKVSGIASLFIGWLVDTTTSIRGRLCEIIIVDGVVSEIDDVRCVAYLKNKWGIL